MSTTLSDWFETPLGQYLLGQEQAYFDKTVADVFGFNAVQLGLAHQDFLRMSRIPLRVSAGPEAGAKVQVDFPLLSFATNSVDLLLLPHVLEFSDNPHQILREAERVLMPEGQLIICGFNPRSLWGAARWFGGSSGEYPWCGRFISLPRLKDWLALLGFEMAAGRLGCYAPPFKQEKWLNRFHWLEAAGDRWWAIAGGVYFLQAIKRVQGLRLLKPNWHEALRAKKALAPVRRECKEPLIRSHVAATVGQALRQTRSEERRVLDGTPATSDKVWSEAQPRPCGLRRNVALASLLGLRIRTGYSLRLAPCLHPHFASNAAHAGPNQRFPGAKVLQFKTRRPSPSI